METPQFTNGTEQEIFYLTKRVIELERLVAQFAGTEGRLLMAESRLKTLEDSRQRQIALNATFALKSEPYKPPANSQATSRWWPWS